MNMPDFKQQAAREAAKLIRPGDTIGLGAGSSMAHLIAAVKEDPSLFRSLKTVTSSFTTRQRLLQEAFSVADSGWLSRVDWYFDGCDQFDRRLNALKSGGGVHAAEKIRSTTDARVASNAPIATAAKAWRRYHIAERPE